MLKLCSNFLFAVRLAEKVFNSQLTDSSLCSACKFQKNKTCSFFFVRRRFIGAFLKICYCFCNFS